MNKRSLSILFCGIAAMGCLAFGAYGSMHDLTGWGFWLVGGFILIGATFH